MAILGNKVELSFAALGKTITWPATPKITQGIQVNYQTWELQHTNYQPSAFGNRATPEIVVSGPWFSRDSAEAQATLEAIHNLRTATMMYYGRNDAKRGTPPPIGRFTAYGLYNKVPVVVKSFQYDFPNDVDYVTAGGPTQSGGNQSGNAQAAAASANDAQAVPVLFDMSVTLIVQMNPIEVVKSFELEKFKSGSLLGEGYI
jgi:hypothetical protein